MLNEDKLENKIKNIIIIKNSRSNSEYDKEVLNLEEGFNVSCINMNIFVIHNIINDEDYDLEEYTIKECDEKEIGLLNNEPNILFLKNIFDIRRE